MKRRIKYIILILLILGGNQKQAFAQEGNPLQFIPGFNRSSFLNPAFQNKTEKLVVGLPLISGAWLDWNANFSLDYVFSKNFEYSFADFYQNLGEPGYQLGQATIPFLFLSLRAEKENFTFSLSDRVLLESAFDHEFLNFIDRGTLPYYNVQAEEFGPIGMHFFHYRDLAFTYSKKVNKRLKIGIRPKVLFGRINYNLSGMNLRVYTDSEAKQLIIEPSGKYKVAGAFEISYNADNEISSVRPELDFSGYIFSYKNPGAALDFGIEYRLVNTEIAVSFADLGFFTMAHKVHEITFTDDIRIKERNLYQSSESEESRYKEAKIGLQNLLDSIPYITSAETTNKRYSQNIPLKLNAAVKQYLSAQMQVGIAAQLTMFNGNSHQYLSSFWQSSVNKHLNLAASLTLFDFEKLLPGIGATYTGERVQYYFSANNVTALVKPASAKYLNLCFGANFLFSTE